MSGAPVPSPDRPNVFTIPAGRPFLDDLAYGIVARWGKPDDPAALGRVTVLLPSRRSARALAEAILRASGRDMLVMPAIRPLGDADEDEALFAEDGGPQALPPEIPRLDREIMLARMVQAFRAREDPVTFAQAHALARPLARWLDECANADADVSRLRDVAPAEFAAHWERTVEFLKIVTEAWPAILAERGALDPAERRARAVRAWARRLQGSDDPVVAAGSSGTIAATADLLKAVAQRPEGAVVLNGLDQGLDQASWDALIDSHPQAALKRLLAHVGADRSLVGLWRPGASPNAPAKARVALLSDALRPPATTGAWARRAPEGAAAGLDGLTLIEAANEREEAAAIACAMRLTLEDRTKTAALVTPDRNLARRVAAELGRWGIVADDSAGTPLAKTEAGALMSLTAETWARDFAPIPLLGALKHRRASLGAPREAHLAAVRRLERRHLRGQRPKDLRDLVDRVAKESDDAEATRLVAKVARAFAPFEGAATLGAWAAAHAQVLDALTELAGGGDPLWSDGADGEATALFLARLVESEDAAELKLDAVDYAAFLAEAALAENVRPRTPKHPRAQIWGLLEARLQRADLMILGGLNEGTWPADPGEDPWMNRAMRRAIGLPAPEQRIGLAGHDFETLAAQPRVVLSRAKRVGGAPATPSRFLTRLKALLAAAGAAAPADPALDLARRLDSGERTPPAERPRPRPPVPARPRELPVTRVETLVRDPYAVYARYILRVRKLDPIDKPLDARERGTLIHAAFEAYTKACAAGPPDDAFAALLEAGRTALGPVLDEPQVKAFWWPRFERAARWFAGLDAEWRAACATLGAEVEGRRVFPEIGFTLTGKADRIERLTGGGLRIVDYKTGRAPTKREIKAFFASQLPLLGLIARGRGFGDGLCGAPAEMGYVRLPGGRVEGEWIPLDGADALIDGVETRLKELIRRYDDPATAYTSRVAPFSERETSDYDHLARLDEWLDADDGEEAGP